ncbi:Nif3-like dinuclear metal center hexameric protein [Arcticibacter eurypsychrophilus]|uniref:Nif3-like dinuclear metal center hexameric protein n=1 Tax=Arcticibacter eurypsychrophilus TaxID=1434752 RepID=UPI00084D1BCD|nr:Nif3-like dinuclear metal center hexameric protein [Arcticibacter eurypsychrophilus]
MKIIELTTFLETLAPLSLQEDYDNSGLIVGEPDATITAAMISLDCTEAVIDEAIAKGCNFVISHHPIVFKGLKKFNKKNYVERAVMKAIKFDIALYAIHTNLDHVLEGVNAKICAKLGIKQYRILSPRKNTLKKLVTFCPIQQADQVRAAILQAGAGSIGNYSDCSFSTPGTGTFKASENANPFVGERGELHREDELRIEIIYPEFLERNILIALLQAHPYEEVAYDLYPLSNSYQQAGAGMIGTLDKPINEMEFLRFVKGTLNAKVIRHTALRGKNVQRVAVCGGTGSFLLPAAIAAGADVFVTADFKYHEFFDAEGKIVISDVGHFETEQFTQELLFENIQKKFPNFAIHLTSIDTNPIKYIF